MIDVTSVLVLAHKELRDARRNRWFLLYTLALAGLSLALSALGTSGHGELNLTGFGRTSASLVNLVMLIVPLMGLTLGAMSLASERESGSLLYLLSQPVTRLELFLGKYLGLSGALLAALLLGFGLSGVIIAWRVGGAHAGAYLGLVGLAFVLALISLSLGLLLSTVARKAATAMGMAIFLWLLLVFFGDLGLMGTSMLMGLDIDQLFALALLNPLQVFKMAAILASRGSLEVLGPAGVYAVRTHGAALLPILLAILSAWIVLPLVGGAFVFRRRAAL